MQMLVILAENAGETVSRDALHQRLWTDAVVTDKALTRLASELRRAFDDDPRDPRIIETVSKRGYRIVAPVAFVNRGDGSLSVAGQSVVTVGTESHVGALPLTMSGRRWTLLVLAGLVLFAIALMATIWIPDWSPTYSPAIQVTSTPGHEISPALSPDGNEVAFSWQGERGDNWDIYVRQPGSDGLLQLTRHPADDLHPTWSPDGSKVAFARFDESSCSILWVPALSGEERRVASCEWVDEQDRPYRTSAIDWSPDGRSIAASDRGIYLIDVDTGERKDITPVPSRAIADINPAFSPDGNYIAFVRIQPVASADLFLVPSEGGAETQLTNEGRLILGHDWTRDGKHILFSSNRTGRFAVWSVSAGGGKPDVVPVDGWNIEKVSVAAEGRRVAYEAWIYDTNIWRVPVDSNFSPERIIASTLWDRHPAFSPDGRRIAFASNRSGDWEIWVANEDGSNQSPLTTLGRRIAGAPSWSPDGDRIAFQTENGSASDIAIVDVETRMVSFLTNDDADDVAPAWSLSGDQIYFGSNRAGDWQIWSKDVPVSRRANGKEARAGAVQVTKDGGYATQASPDGKALLVARSDSSGLWHVPLDGPAAMRISDIPGINDWGNWRVGRDGIYVLQRRTEGALPKLIRLSFDGSDAHEEMSLESDPSPHQPGLSVSPDGGAILLTLVDATESDLFVTELP